MHKQTRKVQKWVKEEGAWLHSKLQSLNGITAHSSAANFQLIQSNNSLLSLREKMAQQKILLRDCRSFLGLGEKWLRISLQIRADNHRIFHVIKKLLK